MMCQQFSAGQFGLEDFRKASIDWARAKSCSMVGGRPPSVRRVNDALQAWEKLSRRSLSYFVSLSSSMILTPYGFEIFR
jgi:hypothetical protein